MKNIHVMANISCHSFGPLLYGDPIVAVFRFNSAGKMTLLER